MDRKTNSFWPAHIQETPTLPPDRARNTRVERRRLKIERQATGADYQRKPLLISAGLFEDFLAQGRPGFDACMVYLLSQYSGFKPAAELKASEILEMNPRKLSAANELLCRLAKDNCWTRARRAVV